MRKGIRKVIIALNSLIFTSCSVIHPQLPPGPFVADTEEPHFSAAVQRANAVNQQLYSRMVEMEQFDFWSGLGLFGAGIAGLSVGVFHGPKHDLLLAGMLGTGLFGLRTFLPFAARKTIYEHGQGAIGCAITALTFEPEAAKPDTSSSTGTESRSEESGGSLEALSSARIRPNESASALTSLLSQSTDLEIRLKRVQQQFQVSRGATRMSGSFELAPAVVAPRIELETKLARLVETHVETRDALKVVKDSLSEQTRARRLDNAVAAIKVAVNQQLNNNGVNPQGAIQSANSQMTSFVAGVQGTVSNVRKKADELYTKAKETEDKAADTKKIAEAVGSSASGATGGSNEIGSSVANSVEPVANVAEEEKKFALDIDEQMRQIQQLLKIPEGCFSGFLGSGATH